MRFFACLLLLLMAAIALRGIPGAAHAASSSPVAVHRTGGSAPGAPSGSAEAISTDPVVPLGRESSLLNRALLLLAATSLGAAYLLWRRT